MLEKVDTYQSPEVQKVGTETSEQARARVNAAASRKIKAALWEWESKRPDNESLSALDINDFLKSQDFLNAVADHNDFFKTNQGVDEAVENARRKYMQVPALTKDEKVFANNVARIRPGLNMQTKIRQETETALVTPTVNALRLETDEEAETRIGAQDIPIVDSLRLETDKEAEARIKALDDRYSVSKSIDRSVAANDPLFETTEQVSVGEVEKPAALETSSAPKVVENIVSVTNVQGQPLQAGEPTNQVQQEVASDIKSQEAQTTNVSTQLSSVQQSQEVSTPVQETKAEGLPVSQTAAEVSAPESANVEQKVNIPESVELAEGAFDQEVKKAFENVVESSIELLNKLDERNRDGLNDLISGPSARRFARAIADIRDNQKLDDGLLNSLNQATDALAEFGVPQEDRLSEDIESLKRLRDTVSDLGQDIGAFGKKIRDTYGDKAEPHIKLLVNLLDSLDLGAQRLTSREYRVRDYLDR